MPRVPEEILQAMTINKLSSVILLLVSSLLLSSCADLSYHPISLLPAGTEDRDQEIAPSAEGQNWDFWHETSARSSSGQVATRRS